jgi:predicted transposase YbfD/YdcC
VVTSLSAEQADATRLAHLVRKNWRIEVLHHVRDVSFGEDASKVRSRGGPENMALLCSPAILLLARMDEKRP